MDKQNRSYLATEVKNLLFRNGFGYAWIHQEVGNEVEFLKSFVQRINDIYRQKWFLDINESPKLSTYSQFKSLLEPEKYLHVINSFWARKQLAKFKTSNHDLAIEKGRHAKSERHVRTSTMCDLGCVEDEYHFILICSKSDCLRETYLPWRFRNFPSSAKFIDLMSLNNDQTVISLSTFIIKLSKYGNMQTDKPADKVLRIPLFRTKMTVSI